MKKRRKDMYPDDSTDRGDTENAVVESRKNKRVTTIYQSSVTGNKNWYNRAYSESVKTERTATTVPVIRKNPYFDNTEEEIKRREQKRKAEERENWKSDLSRNKKEYLRKRRILYSAVIFCAVIVTVMLIYKLFFVADNIVITGNEKYTSEEIISATGLGPDVNLFSFSARAKAQRIEFFCPYVSSAVFDRKAPDTVNISVTEEGPMYYTQLFGDCYLVSPTLRIIGLDNSGEKTENLILLKLGKVKKAIAGSVIQTEGNMNQKILEETGKILAGSSLKSRITCVDLTDSFDIKMTVDHKFLLSFGNKDDLDLKLNVGEITLRDPAFESGNRILVDLSIPGKSSLTVNNRLVLD